MVFRRKAEYQLDSMHALAASFPLGAPCLSSEWSDILRNEKIEMLRKDGKDEVLVPVMFLLSDWLIVFFDSYFSFFKLLSSFITSRTNMRTVVDLELLC